MLRAGGGRNWTHAVLTKLAGTPLSPCDNLAKGAVASHSYTYLHDTSKIHADTCTYLHFILRHFCVIFVIATHTCIYWHDTNRYMKILTRYQQIHADTYISYLDIFCVIDIFCLRVLVVQWATSKYTFKFKFCGTGTVTARRNRTAGALANCLSRHRVGGRGWRRTVTVTCASEKPLSQPCFT